MNVYPVAPNCGSLNVTATDAKNLTLDEALKNITSNTELHLLPGCHYLQHFRLVRDLSNISLIGNVQNNETNVSITCANGLGLAFFNVFQLTITNVTVESCGLSGSDLLAFRNAVRSDIDFFFDLHDDYHVALLCGNCGDLTVSSSTITNTSGLGMLAINAVGTASITDVTFSLNRPENCYASLVNITGLDQAGGGAMFIYHDYLLPPGELPERAIVNIQGSNFLANTYCGLATISELFYEFSEVARALDYTIGAGGGLSIIMAQLNYTVDATVDSCLFRNNSAKFGGGAHVQIFAGVNDSKVSFSNCCFEKNGVAGNVIASINPNEAVVPATAAALAVFNDFIRPSNAAPALYNTRAMPNSIMISGCVFEGNRAFTAGAILIDSLYSSLIGGNQLMVLFDDCMFRNNTALVGAVMYIQELKQSGAQPGMEVIIKDAIVADNEIYRPAGLPIRSPETTAMIDLYSVNVTVTGNSTFSNNKGTAIHCVTSLLYLEDHVIFENNAGVLGGALQLATESFVIVRNNTHVIFRNNSGAILGGAIYSNYIAPLPGAVFSYVDCFLFFGTIEIVCFGEVVCPNITELNFRLDFIDNTSPLGSLIYGSTLETCPWGSTLKEEYNTTVTLYELLYDLFPEKFNFGSVPNNTGLVSTAAGKVAVRDVTQNGSYSLLPGESFNISVIGLDRLGRVIPVILTSHVSNSNSHSVLGLSGYWLTTGQNNTNAPVTVYGKTGQQGINVTLYIADTLAQAQITINLLNCTLGFVYSESSGSCVCDYRLRYTQVYCSESNKDLSVPNDVWVGPGPGGELVVENCLQDFCQIGPKVIKPPNFDPQCHIGFNRTGLLCGTCKEGYSIGFGGNECYQCGNGSLAWIFFFALAGIGIVLVISFVRLTVSDGYLNGIILYANIISLYIHLFTAGSSVNQVFVVIAWLNLDLGINTCFYNGMDSLARAGLQFAFPLYLYALMGVITLIGKKSNKFAMRFNRSGFSAAKLFATLMLMSYTSLLETCAVVLGAVEIKTISGTSSIRWRADPTQVYFSGAHVPLAIVAILVLVFFIIPAPFVLIFPSIAFRLGPIQKLKPIYDAFWAPFKPRYRFWVGLRLLLRVIPFLFAAVAPHPLNILLLGQFLLALLYIQVIVWPFEGRVKNAADIFFIGNLLTIVMGTLFYSVDAYDGKGYVARHDAQFIYFCIVVFVAYAVITAIFMWHVILRFPTLRNVPRTLLKRYRMKRSKSKTIGSFEQLPSSTAEDLGYGATSQAGHDTSTHNDDPTGGRERVKQVNFSELREPLLDDEGLLDLETTRLTL